jgi:hypothetical protein
LNELLALLSASFYCLALDNVVGARESDCGGTPVPPPGCCKGVNVAVDVSAGVEGIKE